MTLDEVTRRNRALWEAWDRERNARKAWLDAQAQVDDAVISLGLALQDLDWQTDPRRSSKPESRKDR